MKNRLWMVAVPVALNLLACAHNEAKPSLQGTKAGLVSDSVSWPLLPINALPQANQSPTVKTHTPNPAQTLMPAPKAPTPITQTVIDPQIIGASSELATTLTAPKKNAAKTVDSRFAVTPFKPLRIAIPKPRESEDMIDTPLLFDIPVAYNNRVKYFIEYFQTSGRVWYSKWLERSSRYLPLLQKTLKKNGLPQDLAYIAMIESGFSSQASSAAKAVGPWQFIRETGTRYGLQVTWWIDERRDFQKSTDAAAKYLKKMYGMFHNWYLVAAGYNTGENRIKRMIQKHGTRNFWKIAQKKDLEAETKDYVPKLIAALLIAKAPQMYGFKNINYSAPLSFEMVRVPGGTRLNDLAGAIGVTAKHLAELNPELVRGYIPNYIGHHVIRVPKGAAPLVGHYIRESIVSER